MAESSPEELASLIAQDPAYGNVICRCEMVTEGEILNAIRRPLGAKSLDGIKRRTRAGMGRCQSGFCSPRVMEILVRELGLDPLSLTKSGGDSRLLTGVTKEIGCRILTVPIQLQYHAHGTHAERLYI